MARKRLVTRNVHTYRVSVLCLDLNTEQPVTKEVTMPRTYQSTDMLKRVQKILDSDECKVCRVLNSEEVVQRYGMPEEEFLKYAKEID